VGILLDFFVGDDATAAEYDGSSVPAVDRAEWKGLTCDVLGGLRAALAGDAALHHIDDFEWISPDDGGESIALRFPADFVSALAAADGAAFARAVSDWALDELGFDDDDAADVVADLVRLAKRARRTGRKLYVWNSP
jgi:hypothetical protein